MKKLFTTLTIVLMFTGSTAWALFWLSGEVSYEGGGGVGSGKPVYVFLSETVYREVDTNSESQYQYGFDSGQYFEKVMSIFSEGGKWYQGHTMIQQNLYEDTPDIDITVSEVQDPGKK